MEPHSLVGGTGEGGWVGMGLACGLQDQRLMARPPARAGGRSGLLTGGESGNPNGYSLPFSQRVPSHIPSPPSRWAGRYGPFAVRAAGRVSCKKYGLPPHNPTREGSPEGRTSSLWGSFPHFFPRNGAPAGQATVPRRSNGAGTVPHCPRNRKPPRDSPAAASSISLSLLIWTKLSRPRPSRSFFWRPARRWGRCPPDAPGQRGCSGRSCRPPPSSSAHTPAPRTTWS